MKPANTFSCSSTNRNWGHDPCVKSAAPLAKITQAVQKVAGQETLTNSM